jgi:hypothetical protein
MGHDDAPALGTPGHRLDAATPVPGEDGGWRATSTLGPWNPQQPGCTRVEGPESPGTRQRPPASPRRRAFGRRPNGLRPRHAADARSTALMWAGTLVLVTKARNEVLGDPTRIGRLWVAGDHRIGTGASEIGERLCRRRAIWEVPGLNSSTNATKPKCAPPAPAGAGRAGRCPPALHVAIQPRGCPRILSFRAGRPTRPHGGIGTGGAV